MPELPEIETTVRELGSKIKGKTIKSVSVYDPALLRNTDPEQLQSEIEGKKITELSRKGKYILLKLDNGKILAIHLRMTGKMLLDNKDEHERICISMDGTKLVMDDVRRFGTLDLIDNEKEPPLENMGIDPFSDEFTRENFEKLLDSEREIKRLLLDQKVLAGLGNIYTDEILHESKISPWKKAKEIDPGKKKILFDQIKETLRKAIDKGGTTISDFQTPKGKDGSFQEVLKIYGKDSHECEKCGDMVSKRKQGGRSTFYCPNCQSVADRSKKEKQKD